MPPEKTSREETGEQDGRHQPGGGIDGHLLVSLTVNGADEAMAIRPDESLLSTIRDRAGVTGTKSVCEMGNCGACTVLLDDTAVYSCLVLTAECADRHVETVESLSTGAEPSRLQQAFADCDALQCGFCTSGQLMSLEALRRSSNLATGTRPDHDDIVEAVTGNLCRCGAYAHIVEAASQALGSTGTPRIVQESTQCPSRTSGFRASPGLSTGSPA